MPRDDKHTLHCINYIRQQIMCHSDTTLGGTDDVHYSLNKGHQCRDYEAVVRWTKNHEWTGHEKWIEKMYGL
ncbi:hypothetical protein BU23DRAFT_555875 [Bimuria novae-zelandiae CBS 107.79]|uniref:Uncharacterized protein n=1 Tax=Bimuria novae-zelandiae CBS 107.79 TaxID=1447943 RepID=A0A6A5VEP6_9PLEO|nr:hypothetical protein BU23DRAFT_555875 [Bimuria novae-zelandiae CBS 107.79]